MQNNIKGNDMKKQLNDAMKNADNILGNDKGHVAVYCAKAHLVGNITVEMARDWVQRGWCYVETTSDIVHYDCTCGHRTIDELTKRDNAF
jgi:hypothetical protein